MRFLISIGIIIASISFISCTTDRELLKEQANLHYRTALSYMMQADYTTALRELLIAAEKDPENQSIQSALGLIYYNKGLYREAVTHYKRAIELNPRSAEASSIHNNLGVVYLAIGDFDSAISEFKKALADVLYPTPEIAYNNMGWAFYKKGLIERAIENYKMAIKQNPSFPQARNNLGIALFEKGRLEEAESELKKALEIFPGYTEARFYLGKVYLKMGQKKKALQEFEYIVRESPEGEYKALANQYIKDLE